VLSFFLKPLILTLLTESLVAFCFGFRKPKQFLTLSLVNLITNPLLNYILLLYGFLIRPEFPLAITTLVEIIIVLAEYKLLALVLSQEKKSKLFTLALAANLTSFLIGLILL
jgi:hypothetical protein